MADIEKVIKGLETCVPMKYETAEDKECRHEQCPYGRENHKTTEGCIWDLMADALELLKDYKQHLQNDLEILKEEKRRLEFEHEAKAIREKIDEVIAKLKEKHPCEECQEWECDGCPYSDK